MDNSESRDPASGVQPEPSNQPPSAVSEESGADDESGGAEEASDGGSTPLEGADASSAEGQPTPAPGPGMVPGTGRRRRRRRRRGRGAQLFFTAEGQAYRMQSAPDGQQVQVFLTPQEVQQYQARLAQQQSAQAARLPQAGAIPAAGQPAALPQLAPVEGVLDTEVKGPNAFLRQIKRNLLPSPEDPELPKNTVQKLRLRQGQDLTALAQMRGPKGLIQKVEMVDGVPL
ncbi:MAG TPA: transcription termination factor Rho, partial [Myxococcaceae bacterium]|nr:transcription termination factor Rho [Myxococcaceae bacterium]